MGQVDRRQINSVPYLTNICCLVRRYGPTKLYACIIYPSDRELRCVCNTVNLSSPQKKKELSFI